MEKAKVMQRKKKAMLIELEDKDRVIIPAVEGANTGDTLELSEDVIEQAMPYGLPIASLVGSVCISGKDVEKAFHNYGIWTLEDFDKNSSAVIQALQSVIGVEYHRIYQIVHTYAKESRK